MKPDVVILDLAMAGLQGLNPVHQLVAAAPGTKVIGLSMYSDRRFVVEVLKAGAFGYVLKEHAFEELAVAIRAVQAHQDLYQPRPFRPRHPGLHRTFAG